MKKSGIVRKIDHLGRIVLPMELRRALKMAEGDCVEFFADGEKLALRKYDISADLMDILEGTESSIRLQEGLCPDMTSKLLAQLEEMKALVAGK